MRPPELGQAVSDQASAGATPAGADAFTEDELRRLLRLRGVVAAERHLVARDQACPDHRACRRLAFVHWLYATHRLFASAQP